MTTGSFDLTSVAITLCVAIAVAGTGVTVLQTYTDAYDSTFEQCDEQYGADGWVFVEVSEPPWWHIGPQVVGETECVGVNSERADDCVIIPSVIADYNARCEGQR